MHDRDLKAAINILNVVETATQPITKVETVKETVAENPIQLSLFVSVAPPQEAEVAGGQSETLNKTRSRRNSTRKKVVANSESSTRPGSFKQLSLFD